MVIEFSDKGRSGVTGYGKVGVRVREEGVHFVIIFSLVHNNGFIAFIGTGNYNLVVNFKKFASGFDVGKKFGREVGIAGLGFM